MSAIRGASLVDKVFAEARDRFSGGGLTESDLANLTLNGKPLPPSLSRYLTFDTGWAEFDFQPRKLSQFMGREFEEFEKLLPGECYGMRASYTDCTSWFLYAGESDELGEYPIFLADIDDWYLVKIEYAGFDVFLADAMLGDYADEAALERQAHRNYRGYSFCELFGEAATIDGKKSSWEGLPKPSYDDL